MNITTIPKTDKDPTALLVVNCEDSTAVSKVVVTVRTEFGEAFVHVAYRSGAEWGYFVPNSVVLVGLGERSVGRFVASVIKPNATYAVHLNKEREAVGV